MSAISTANRRTLQSALTLFVVLGLTLTEAVIAQDDVDETPEMRKIRQEFENTVTDLKGFRQQNNNVAEINVGLTDAGMKELSECNTLWALTLYGVKLPPTGLKGLGRLKKLKELDIFAAPVTDADLSEIKVLSNLTSLRLGSSRSAITDAGLRELQPLKNLVTLRLGYAHMTDAGLTELRGFQKLTKLSVNHTRITDGGLKQLCQHKNLKDLDLSGTKITDAGLKELRGLANLARLDLRETAITDAGLKELSQDTNLTELVLINTPITDRGIQELGRLKKLTALWLDKTKTTDAAVARLGKALPNARIVR